MATELDKFPRIFEQMAYNLGKMDRFSHQIANNFDKLINQIQRERPLTLTQFMAGGPQFDSYLMQISRIGPMFKAMSLSMKERTTKDLEDIKELGNKLKAARIEANRINQAIRASPTPLDAVGQLRAAQDTLKPLEAQNAALMRQVAVKKEIAKLTGQEFSFQYLVLVGLKDAIQRSGEFNRSMIDANSSFAERDWLQERAWRVMGKTGVSQQSVIEGSKALLPLWKAIHGDFEDTLGTMVMMKEGLGVSYENSLDLARVFEVNLKTPVRDIAEQIANIKNSTSLAADQATHFAAEIGRALTLIGPAGQTQVSKTVGYVTQMAARMQDVGGSAEDLVKFFQSMTEGGGHAMWLRGVVAPGGIERLGTEGGAREAFKNLGEFIRQQLGTGNATEHRYRLELVADMLKTSQINVLKWSEMLVKSNQPLATNKTLHEAFQEQMVKSNEILQKLKNALIGLIQRAIDPLLNRLYPVIKGLANFVDLLAGSKGLVKWLEVDVVFAITAVIVSFGRLVWGIRKAVTDIALMTQLLTSLRPTAAVGTAAAVGSVLPSVEAGVASGSVTALAFRQLALSGAGQTAAAGTAALTARALAPSLLARGAALGALGLRFLPAVGGILTIGTVAWMIYSIYSQRSAETNELLQQQTRLAEEASEKRKLLNAQIDAAADAREEQKRQQELNAPTYLEQRALELLKEHGTSDTDELVAAYLKKIAEDGAKRIRLAEEAARAAKDREDTQRSVENKDRLWQQINPWATEPTKISPLIKKQ